MGGPRPTEAMLRTVAVVDLSEVAAEINKNHELAVMYVGQSFDHAVKAGLLLIEAKKLVKHGEWKKWLKANVKVGARQASNYMRAFLPLLNTTIDCPAWRAMSHGAKWLYVALKRKANSGPRAYLSYREAMHQCRAGRGKIREWFAELQHYGFIRLHAPGCLGTDGKGKSPHWRLTEKGQTSKASPDGLFEPPPDDFLKWDGTPFDPKPYRLKHGATKWDEDKLKNPSTHVSTTPVPTSGTPPVPTSGTPQNESGTHVSSIEGDNTGTHVRSISSLTTCRASQDVAPVSPQPSSESPLEEETKIGLSEAGSNVIHLDPRIAALEAAEKRRKLR